MLEQAKWIGCSRDMGEICPEFGVRFAAEKEVCRAALAVTAVGAYEAHINGKRVGEFVLAPGCTAYEKRLQVQTYDVTALLGTQNLLTVTVGSGWHRGRISAAVRAIHEMPCAVIAELTLEYSDGSRRTVATDESWQVRESRTLSADIYDGECYDASRPEADWEAVCVPALSGDRLIGQEGEIVREQERIRPARIFTSPKGERIVDFGQNLAGYVELSVNAKAGERIVLSHAEVLDQDGNFYTENYRSAKAQLTYICRDGEQTWHPHFSFFGYRYIRIDEFPGEVGADNFTSVAVYSDLKRTGMIRCGNPKVNRLFENTLWSQRSNFVDVPTDCPQRDERMGWTGDAQVFAKTASYNYDVDRFYTKWLRDVRAEQFESGLVPDTVPNFWQLKGGSTAWGDVITIMPWQMYLTYGDREALVENFGAMKRWVDYMTADSDTPYLWTCRPEEKALWRKHYGDWLAQDAPYGSYKGATDDDLIASAFYINSIAILVKAGRVLGKDMAEYEALYEKCTEAFRTRFTELPTQTAKVLALQFGLTKDREETAGQLVRMIRENGNRLETGFVGTPYLLHVLSENGYQDVSYDLLLQEAFPSWLYEVNHGATTIWEHWDGVRDDGTMWSKDMNSYNHYAYGCVIDWLYTVAAGIRPAEDAPGFEKALICPVSDKRLSWLEASLETGHGVIRSGWVCEGERTRYEISTPVPAKICIGGKERCVEAGDYVFYG